ncbi:cell division protein FtsW [Breoghania corrubedonensis]|uniref:Probable peptidoglycan glycosyltransferase FtsW n=1 Tax=Breoghania corrubedonensis TaxID=665038 RepID=A0A2T5V4Y3_9HYPH|nr:putative lipid II flippase FtsW [Breoghania corrubedonensis]PTW58809.1 cell division protein FtsW [Breoghania corrubedonensis]
MASRVDRSAFSEWLWTVDHLLLAGFVALMLGGVVLSFAGSPPVAERLGLEPYFFVKRQALYLFPALAVMLGASMLTPRMVRRAALVIFALGLVALVLVLFTGVEVKGARRWIDILGFSIQPSEFIKPAFVILIAFLLSEAGKRPEVPGRLFSILLFVMVAALFIAQPDFGQTMLLLMVWAALFFMAGLSWVWIGALGLLGVASLGSAYMLLPHVTARINRFINPGSGDTYQVDTALEAIVQGGWLGRGPGEGTVKRILPDSHTDFIFAVAAEEFGIIMCIVLLSVFAFVVLRGLTHARREPDPFVRLATAGLMVMFGIQSAINMAVNLNMMPAKGMTLPFISYGGSSMLAVALAMGFVLALTRKRPRPSRTAPVVVRRVARVPIDPVK